MNDAERYGAMLDLRAITAENTRLTADNAALRERVKVLEAALKAYAEAEKRPDGRCNGLGINCGRHAAICNYCAALANRRSLRAKASAALLAIAKEETNAALLRIAGETR